MASLTAKQDARAAQISNGIARMEFLPAMILGFRMSR